MWVHDGKKGKRTCGICGLVHANACARLPVYVWVVVKRKRSTDIRFQSKTWSMKFESKIGKNNPNLVTTRPWNVDECIKKGGQGRERKEKRIDAQIMCCSNKKQLHKCVKTAKSISRPCEKGCFWWKTIGQKTHQRLKKESKTTELPIPKDDV